MARLVDTIIITGQYQFVTTVPERRMLTDSVIENQRICLSVAETAAVVGVSQSFVRLEIRRGRLRTTKVGRRRLILRSAITEWLQDGTPEGSKE